MEALVATIFIDTATILRLRRRRLRLWRLVIKQQNIYIQNAVSCLIIRVHKRQCVMVYGVFSIDTPWQAFLPAKLRHELAHETTKIRNNFIVILPPLAVYMTFIILYIIYYLVARELFTTAVVSAERN